MTTKLTVDIKVNESVVIGSSTVRLEKKSGQIARLVITANKETIIQTPNESRKSVIPSTT